MKKTISEIFDFGDNKVYSYFFSHLDSNIKQYIRQQYEHKASKDFFTLDVDKLTDIVKFVIVHGFDYEAAKREEEERLRKEQEKNKKKEEPKEEKPKEEKPPAPPRPRTPPPPPEPVFANVKPRISTRLEVDKIP